MTKAERAAIGLPSRVLRRQPQGDARPPRQLPPLGSSHSREHPAPALKRPAGGVASLRTVPPEAVAASRATTITATGARPATPYQTSPSMTDRPKPGLPAPPNCSLVACSHRRLAVATPSPRTNRCHCRRRDVRYLADRNARVVQLRNVRVLRVLRVTGSAVARFGTDPRPHRVVEDRRLTQRRVGTVVA